MTPGRYVFQARDLLAALRRAGFEAEAVFAFGRFVLPEEITGFVARKRRRGDTPTPNLGWVTPQIGVNDSCYDF